MTFSVEREISQLPADILTGIEIFNQFLQLFHCTGLIATMFSILKLHLVASKCQDREENCKFCFSGVWCLLYVMYSC